MLKPVLGSQLQLGHPLARGLAGCWLMNEGSGDKVSDLSGNDNTGTFQAGAAKPIWIPGNTGPAVRGDGGDQIKATIKGINPSAISVVISVKPTDGYSSGGTDEAIFELVLSSEYLLIYFNDDGKLRALRNTTSGGQDLAATTATSWSEQYYQIIMLEGKKTITE